MAIGSDIFSHITERDIDLLLVEELKCSDSFAEWFLGRIFAADDTEVPYSYQFAGVRHSVKGIGKALGESDLELRFEGNDGEGRTNGLLVLIENKIDAEFQPSQPARYRLRADAVICAGDCDAFLSVLIAPKSYLDAAAEATEFDQVISYEEIMAHFNGRASAEPSEVARRCQHRAYVLKCAIDRFRRGYNPVADAKTTAVWLAYFEIARRLAPELGMERPGTKPVASSFVIFPSLPARNGLPRCTLKHKLCHSLVELEFAGWGHRVDEMKPKLAAILTPDMLVRKAGKSLAIGFTVPAVDLTAPAGAQQAQLETGIRTAARLRAWFDQNTKSLESSCSK